MEQRSRDLEIVRQTAELLASGEALSEIFERLCVTLAQFIDASVVFIAIAQPEGIFLEYAFDHGVSWRDAHVPIAPGSQTQRVIDSGRSICFGSRSQAGTVVPLRVPGAHEEDSSSAIFVPLRVGKEIVGVLSVQSSTSDAYDEKDVHLMETCALYLAVAVHAERVTREARALVSEHSIDPVSGVPGRRTFDERLRQEWQRARRDNSPLSVLLLDIDWFKRFNDTYGHVAGDACLRQVAQTAHATLTRETDLFARYGGEEFSGILWATDSAGAYAAAERMRQAIFDLDIPHVDSPLARVTVSIGVATLLPSASSEAAIVRAADRALYAAKTSGRNRVVLDQFDTASLRPQTRTTTNNLTPVTTSFIGRTAELNELMQLLSASRLVTLVGPGGAGKTRLATTAAQRRLYAYLDGVWFVDLHAVASGEFVTGAVAHALGVGDSESILREIEDRNMLLLFDNCEHVLEAVASFAARALAVAPALTILATSREALHLAEERTIVLGPLDEHSALALFVERARTAFPPFVFDERERDTILRICETLDFLPLAIELAAPRVKTLDAAALLETLEDRFRVLVSAKRATDSRHRTLFATVEWSFNLLDTASQRLLESASVFSGSVDPDALRDVCADRALEPWDLGDAVVDLIEKNLISVIALGRSERFTLLESTRAFARMRLAERLDAADVERRYIRYYRALAKRIGDHFNKHAVEAAIALMKNEWDNFRGALDVALRRCVDPNEGRAIVRALSPWWSESGRLSEGLFWCERALETPIDDPDERADLLYLAALLAHGRGDFVRLATVAQELIEIHEKGANTQKLAQALNALGNARFKTGRAAEAKVLYERALAAYRHAGDVRGTAVALMNLGSLLADWQLDYEQAKSFFEESLTLFRTMGISANIGIVLANLGEIAGYQARFSEALRYAQESLSIFERLGHRTLAGWQMVDIARYNLGLENRDEALRALRQARRYLEHEAAAEHHAQYIEAAFLLATDAGSYDFAARLAGHLERYRAEHHQPRSPSLEPPFRQRIDAVRSALTAAHFERAYAQGALAKASVLADELDGL